MAQLGRPAGLRAGFHAAADDPVSGLLHAGEQWAPVRFLIDRHSHPVWELYFQMHGVTRWTAAGRSYVVRPGDLFGVAPGVTHQMAGRPVRNHHFAFAALDPGPALRRHPALAGPWRDLPDVVHREHAEALAEPFARLTGELTARHEFAGEGLTVAVDALVVTATRLLMRSAPASRLAVHPAVQLVKDLLDRHYERRWTLRDLSGEAGLSPAYLAGLFTAELGRPPHRYLAERRIDQARRLLAGSDLTVTAIAVELGFGSSQHFARAFRQHVGRTPTAYRRAVAEGGPGQAGAPR